MRGHVATKSSWTRERIAAEAARYRTRTEFKRRNGYAYKMASALGILQEVCAGMGPYVCMLPRTVYFIHATGTHTIYIGITARLTERIMHHRDHGRKVIRDVMAGPHKVIVLHEGMLPEAAANCERSLIDIVRSCGWNVLNIQPGGSLGIGPRRWVKERVKDEASRYKSRSEFAKKSEAAYRAAIKNGWLDECVEHMGPPKLTSWDTRRLKAREKDRCQL